MAIYKMTAKELILTSGSSRGSQIKFYKDGYWYKIDEQGPEGRAEELASKILSCSNLNDKDIVKYESCIIEYSNKRYKGCRSKDFLNPGEQLYSFERIYNLMTGTSLTEKIQTFSSPKEKIGFTKDVIKEFCGLDVSEYISKVLTSSMILLDTDKHLNNFAIIANQELDTFRAAPIFDNGASFLSNYNIYPLSIRIEDICGEKVNIIGKPFSANLEYQVAAAGVGIKFDFPEIIKIINFEPESRMKEIAEFNITKYEKIQELQMTILEKMEKTWYDYFDSALLNRNGIEWEGKKLRPAVFEDLYLAECQKEKIASDSNISNHFWNNCVKFQDYSPQFCQKDDHQRN